MWTLVRCTVRRTAPISRILSRVWRARRRRAGFFCFICALRPPLLLLRFFEHDRLARVAHALARVGLGGLDVAALGRDAPDQLLVDAADDDLGLRRRRHLDALGHLLHPRVRPTPRPVELVTRGLRAVAAAHP